MELTAMAQWLNSAFHGYDYAILGALHTAAEAAGSFLTPVMKVITLLGEKGLLMFLVALVLLCFPRTRRMGVCVFGAVCCGALITNLILKDMVARPRPFETVDLYRQWWNFVGSPLEDDFSFPSGHVTAITAGMTALSLTCRRRHKGVMVSGTVLAVLLMAISRNYMVAHYPSDVLFAAVIGFLSAVIAYLITLLIFRILENHDDVPFCAAVLDFDIRDLFAGRGKAKPAKKAAAPKAAVEDEDDAVFDRDEDFAPEPATEFHAAEHVSHEKARKAASSGGYVPKH